PTASQLAEGVYLGTIPLNAVHPNFQGRGIYKKLVRAALSFLSQNGAKTAEIRTQITNSAVHRTWENLGGHLYFAYHRFHLSL
ncbi:MAG: GNAT family N-acetyltransferase, partial [Candidatus Obscuribacterales bacterium]|nr:GNAT family N-acetyltransferase [Candidatus Obscuribacterales bacterium]